MLELTSDSIRVELGIRKLSTRRRIDQGMHAIPCLAEAMRNNSSAPFRGATNGRAASEPAFPDDPTECMALAQSCADTWHPQRWCVETLLGPPSPFAVFFFRTRIITYYAHRVETGHDFVPG